MKKNKPIGYYPRRKTHLSHRSYFSFGLIIIAVGLFIPPLPAQPRNEWLRFYDMNIGVESFFDVYAGADFYAMTGYSSSLGSLTEFWVVVTETNGELIWQHTYSNNLGRITAWAYSIVGTDDNGFLIGGYYHPSGEGLEKRYTLVKISEDGEQQWWREYCGNNRGECRAVIEMKSGDYFSCGIQRSAVVGYCNRVRANGDLIWEQEFNQVTVFHALREIDRGVILVGVRQQQLAGWIISLDEEGDIIWTRQFIDAWFQDIASCQQGGYIIAGRAPNPDGQTCCYLMRINNNGATLWANFYDFASPTYNHGVRQLPDGGFAVSLNIGQRYDSPVILRIDEDGQEMWRRLDHNRFGNNGPDEYYAITVTPDGFPLVAGRSVSEISGTCGILVKTLPDRSAPEIIVWSPEEFDLKILRGESIQFVIQAEDIQDDSLRYRWLWNSNLVSENDSTEIIFQELGDDTVKCIVSDGQLADSLQWIVKVRELYIHSQSPSIFRLTIRRNTTVPFSIDSIAYIDDGRGRPAYRWSLIDRLDDDRRAEAGQDSAVDIRFERKGRFAIEGLAYLGDSRDSVTWEVEVRGIIRAYWPRCEVVSIRPGEEAAFGVAPFEPEDRRPRLSYRWQVDQVDIVDEDSSEVRLVFPNRGRFEVGVFVTDSMQVDSVNWELAETDSQRWTVNVAIPDWIVNSKFQIPNSKFDIAPNPFNALAEVKFELEQTGDVKLQMFDVQGRLVWTPVDGWREAGRHSIAVEGGDLPAGIYIFRLKTEHKTITRKVVLIR